jgi:hypothetical protein
MSWILIAILRGLSVNAPDVEHPLNPVRAGGEQAPRAHVARVSSGRPAASREDTSMTHGATPEMTGNPLISASKVQGSAVFNMEGERLGHVEDIVLHKMSGKVAFAIMSFGGFLGSARSTAPSPGRC